MKLLLLLLRLQLMPLRRGRKGHLKRSLSQPRSLSLSRSPRPTGKRGRLSPLMVTMRPLLLHAPLHPAPFVQPALPHVPAHPFSVPQPSALPFIPAPQPILAPEPIFAPAPQPIAFAPEPIALAPEP